jgi:hypothetical protein
VREKAKVSYSISGKHIKIDMEERERERERERATIMLPDSAVPNIHTYMHKRQYD